MPALGLSHTNLRADRQTIDSLRDFYVGVVGLSVGYRPPFHNDGYWLYINDWDVLHLSEAGANENRPANVINTFHHVAFSCSNRTEFEQRLRLLAIDYISERVPLTDLHQLFCSDPAGNGVELNFKETPT